MLKKLKRRIRWTIYHGVFMTLAIYGAALGVAPAANVLKFLIWLVAPGLILGAFFEKTRAEKREKGPSVPVGLTLFVDLAIACLLAAYGWFGHAALFMFGSAFGVSAHLSKPDPEPEKAQATGATR